METRAQRTYFCVSLRICFANLGRFCNQVLFAHCFRLFDDQVLQRSKAWQNLFQEKDPNQVKRSYLTDQSINQGLRKESLVRISIGIRSRSIQDSKSSIRTHSFDHSSYSSIIKRVQRCQRKHAIQVKRYSLIPLQSCLHWKSSRAFRSSKSRLT